MHSSDEAPHTVVVVPSVSLDSVMVEQLSTVQPSEERFLILLMLLRQPQARLVYVTSESIPPAIVDYYLHLMPGVIPGHARQRLFLLSVGDGSLRPLSEKLLERPRLLARIRDLAGDVDAAYLVPFNTTELERDLAERLDIPLYGAHPRFERLGGKSGSRKLFAEEGVPHPPGHEDLTDLADVVGVICKMRAEDAEIESLVLKTNQGVGGIDNVSVGLDGLPAPGDREEQEAVEERLRSELDGDAFEEYDAKLRRGGGVVEAQVSGRETRSPSVQFRITPLGEVELLSTHDQVLSGQQFVGSRFPADGDYAVQISHEAEKVARRLAREGVIGRGAVDFVVVRSDGEWEAFAIELNLRRGGTTHPFLTLQFLTDGRYEPDEAAFIAPSGQRKFFVASDHIESPHYKRLTSEDLFEAVVRHGLHFDQARQTGVVFHMISALSETGRTGVTAVGNSPGEADELFRRAQAALDEEAEGAFEERPS